MIGRCASCRPVGEEEMQPYKYLTVFNLGIQNTFVYRWNYLLRAIFGIIPLVGTVFLWRAIFHESGGGMRGYDYGSMIYYYLLTILVSNLVTPTEDEWQIAADIREGQINSFLTKPMSYLGYRFSIFLSGRLVYTAVTILPIAAIFFYFRRFIVLPNDPVTWLAAFVSLLMSAFIQFFLTYALSMMAFWILEISTIVFIVYSFEYFLGGQMFPLDIMPPAIQAVMKWLPFYYELFCPIAIFQGRLHGPEMWGALVIQCGWMLAMWTGANLMWKRGLGHYQAVGG
jgi:ABC-2 type transport system permease protein